MAKPSKEKNYAYQMRRNIKLREEQRRLREEERYNSLCGPVTIIKKAK